MNIENSLFAVQVLVLSIFGILWSKRLRPSCLGQCGKIILCGKAPARANMTRVFSITGRACCGVERQVSKRSRGPNLAQQIGMTIQQL